MLEVKTIEIAGFLSAVEALRLPFGKECRSETEYSDSWVEKYIPNFQADIRVFFNEKDLALMSTLVKRGDEHAKVLRGIIVYAEINAPRFWWVEMDTYRIGSERLSSESTMHIQGRGMSTEELVKMKSELTEGTMQKRVQYFSYQALRRIYQQRRNHRLPHWHIFCDWIKTLPFANELILIGLDDSDCKEDKR
jgi:hypothetical protein